jgi:hypothetical protein
MTASEAAVSNDSEAGVAALLARDPGALLVACEPVVGALIAGWEGWRASKHLLAVPPERCAGAGSAAVSSMRGTSACVPWAPRE